MFVEGVPIRLIFEIPRMFLPLNFDDEEEKKFHDSRNRIMNFQFKKATDFKQNKIIKIPDPLETNDEIKIGYFKEELIKVKLKDTYQRIVIKRVHQRTLI